jgi:hypothetical protein
MMTVHPQSVRPMHAPTPAHPMMIAACVSPMAIAPFNDPHVFGAAAVNGTACWPTPGTLWDPELERLRQLERSASREQEKQAIRERLRRMGVPEDQVMGPNPWYPYPVSPSPFPAAIVRKAPPLTPTLETIIAQARRASGK